MLTSPRNDPNTLRTVGLLNEELLRLEPEVLGVRNDGTTLHVRYRAALATPWVYEHLQSTDAGEGGGTYDDSNYTSSTKVDCRANRVQDVSVADKYGTRYYLFLVPVQEDGAGTDVKYDGVDGDDHMAYADLGGA